MRLISFTFTTVRGKPDANALTMFMATDSLTSLSGGNRTNLDDTVNWTAANRGRGPSVTAPNQFHLLRAEQSRGTRRLDTTLRPETKRHSLINFTFLAQGSPEKPDAVILHSARPMLMAAGKLTTRVVCRGEPDKP